MSKSSAGGSNGKKGRNLEVCARYKAAGRQEINAKRKQVKHRRLVAKHEVKRDRVIAIRKTNAEKKPYSVAASALSSARCNIGVALASLGYADDKARKYAEAYPTTVIDKTTKRAVAEYIRNHPKAA